MADAISVIDAVYGYASVVTSRPRARAPSMMRKASGVRSSAMLFRCTTCTGAPDAAASAITSWSSATMSPARMWTKTGRLNDAAS